MADGSQSVGVAAPLDLANSEAALLAQYNNHFQSLHASSSTRGKNHSLFLVANTMILSGVALSSQNGESVITIDHNFILFTCVAGVLLSFAWWAVTNHYRSRSKVVVSLLMDMEESLPVQFFRKQRLFTSKSWLNRIPSADLWLPWLFAALYVGIGIGLQMEFFKLGT